MRSVLLTGATGRIGKSFFEFGRDRYRFRLAARRIERMGDVGDHEAITLDVADLDACRAACRGMDSVLHLAADPSPSADFYGSLLDNNIKGAFNVFQAAHEENYRRVVYASSIQLVEGYPLDVQAREDMPGRAVNMYGACKAFAEATAHYFAKKKGLSSLCVRVGNYQGNSDSMQADGRRLSAWISERDMNHLFERAIEVEDLDFAILHAVSDNRFKRMDISETRRLIGYEPQDDSFRFFGAGLEYGPRWYDEAPGRSQSE